MRRVIFGALILFNVAGATHAGSVEKSSNDKYPNWDGIFIGVKIGNSQATSSVTNEFHDYGTPTTLPSPLDWLEISNNSSGYLTENSISNGLILGYNMQHNSILYGVEADITAVSFLKSRNRTINYPPEVGGGIVVSDQIKSSYQISLRGKFGVIKDEFLIYLTGGVALSNLDHSHEFSEFGYEPNNYTDEGGATEEAIKLGWVIGIGSEWRVNQNWSFVTEYLHSRYPSTRGSTQWYDPGLDTVFTESLVNHSADLGHDIIRVGINYRF